jgi:hypothetical protein
MDPNIYDNPEEFQPFRFFSDDPDVPKKDMVTISLEFLPFSLWAKRLVCHAAVSSHLSSLY